MIERTDNVKTALTQLAQQASSSGKAIKNLTWRMNSGDGFLPMALLKAEPGATVRVEMMEGGWSSGEGWITRLTRPGLSAQTARPTNCAAGSAAPVIWSWRYGRCRAPPPSS